MTHARAIWISLEIRPVQRALRVANALLGPTISQAKSNRTAWSSSAKNVEREALYRWRNAVPAHGRLSGGDLDHCCDAFQIGSLTIVEWSHNGTCRLWTQNDKNCPQFYKADYSESSLRTHPVMAAASR